MWCKRSESRKWPQIKCWESVRQNSFPILLKFFMSNLDVNSFPHNCHICAVRKIKGYACKELRKENLLDKFIFKVFSIFHFWMICMWKAVDISSDKEEKKKSSGRKILLSEAGILYQAKRFRQFKSHLQFLELLLIKIERDFWV